MQPEPPPGASAHDGPAHDGPAPGAPAPGGPDPEGPAPRPPVPPEPATGQGPPGRLRASRMPPRPGRVRNPVWYALVTRAEHAEQEALGDVHRAVPAWRRSTRGEHRWPVTISVILAIVLQRLLPDQLSMRPLPSGLLPILEGGVLVALAIANPVRIERRGVFVRWVSIVLILLITSANAASAVLLIREIIKGGSETSSAGPLLASGAAIWATNVIAFALWYWEFDRGGPVHRAHGTFQYLDFLFPQMTIDHLVDPDWEPRFVDYLYLSFTNATAFSPTDVMPLARWAKLTMLVQSAVSLSLGALVIARAVNILPTG
ncbi:MAG TPA: hypothetical protein VIK57_00425 [Streptosporangiaceae bacterium]